MEHHSTTMIYRFLRLPMLRVFPKTAYQAAYTVILDYVHLLLNLIGEYTKAGLHDQIRK